MKKTALWILIFALAAGGAYYIWQQNRQDAEPAVVEKQSLPLPEEPLEPAIKYPVPQPPVQIDTQVVVPNGKTVVTGATDRRKLVEIRGDPAALQEAVAALLQDLNGKDSGRS